MSKPKIAFFFRYGPAVHSELFHAIPNIVEQLEMYAEVHYFGCKTDTPLPQKLRNSIKLHELPLHVDRTRMQDKLLKTFLWIVLVPGMAVKCRKLGIQLIYVDETIPLVIPLIRLFFKGKIALTVADQFVDIYMGKSMILRPIANLIKTTDMQAWKRADLIFTRAKSTKNFLSEAGIRPDIIHPVYDPCDFNIYHPLDARHIRRRYGFSRDDVVLVHHGILHPNKGNAFIIKAISELLPTYPHLKYLLVGDGPDMQNLRHLTAQLRMESTVTFTGWLPSLEDVNEHLNAGDIGLVMRTGEKSDDFHMTGALVHSMACGLPLAAAKLGGVSEVVDDGVHGHLFSPGDPDSFKNTMKKLLADPATRLEMGKRSLAASRVHFDMEKTTESTVTPLLEILRSSGRYNNIPRR